MEHKEILVKLLGLPATADDAIINSTASKFQESVCNWKQTVEQEFAEKEEALTNAAETAKQEAAETKSKLDAQVVANSAMLAELVEHDLATYKDRIENSAEIKDKLTNDRAGTIAILKNMKAPAAPAAKPAPLHNANTAGQPASLNNAATVLSAQDTAKISNRAKELGKTLKLPFQQAWKMAENEVAKSAQV